jgi:hypothetical protein
MEARSKKPDCEEVQAKEMGTETITIDRQLEQFQDLAIKFLPIKFCLHKLIFSVYHIFLINYKYI